MFNTWLFIAFLGTTFAYANANPFILKDTCDVITAKPTIIIECPDEFVWNPETKVCEFTECKPTEPETTTCTTEDPCTTTCSTTEDPCTEATTTECPPPYPPCEPIPDPVCPEHDPAGWAVLLPDPKDCGSFYKCDWGVLYHFRCPGGLHFNNVLKVCDWPQYAGCSCDSKPTEPPPVTDPCESTEEPTTTPCSTTEDPCTEATTTECPPPYPPCEPIPEPVCPEHDPEGWAVLLPDPKDCGSFYKCDWGVLYHFRCPDGLHFNNVLKVCDWPQYAGCSCDSKPTDPPPVTDPCESTEEPTTTPCSTTEDPCTEATTTECPPPYPPCEPIPEPVCPEHDPEGWAVLLPDPKDCGSFYKCDWGVLYHFRCPDGLHFNNVLKVCDWPQYAGCSCDSKPTEPPPVTDPCESSTEPETTPCTACTPPEPETTTCSTEEPTTTPCSTTEDPCTEATTTECPPPYPPCEPIPEPVCPEHDPEGWAVLLPDPKDCGSFYKCDWGVLYHFRCPGGLHFNNVLKVCDWPQYAGCSCDSKPTEPPPVTDPCESTEEPTTTPCSTTEDPCTEATTTECPPPYPPCEPIPEPVCPEHDPEGWAVLLPDPKDCGSFYKCDWGVLYHFRCPGGLHFNNVLKVCDWPQYAGCSCDSKPTEPPPVTDPCESSTEPETTPCTACTPPEPETTTCSTEEPTTTPCSTTEDPCTEATTTECPPPYPPCEPIPEPVCPEHDPEGWAVLLPDPKDCGSFYKCDWGVLYHFRCPGGLHFNNVLKVCDWPQYAGCSCDSKPTEPPPVTDPCESTEEPTTTPCSTTEDPCTEATTTECPPPYPPCEPIPEPVCPEHDPEGWAVLLPDPKDCGSFYKCDWGVLYHFRCPGGLHFNNVLKVCDWPQYAGCSCDSKPTEPPPVTDPCESTEEPTTTPCSTTEDPCTEATTTECPPPYPPCEPIPEPVCPEHDPEGWAVLLPDPKDCGSFYKCDWGVLYHFRCPGGLHFNNVLKVCDWPQYAGCSCDSKPTEPPPVTDPCESSTEPETTPCTACTPPEPETTTCSTEEPTTTPCSTTEDPCTEATTTECPPPYPPCEPIPEPVCPEHDPEGWAVLLPDPKDCGSFYKCDWGVLYHFRCPGGLHFNNVLKVCDWPQYAGCSCDSKPTEPPPVTDPCESTEEPTTTPCSTTEDPCTEATTTECPPPYPPCEPIPEPVCPEHDPEGWAVLLPDPKDCGSFYKCDWGVLYHFRCPGGLHFNNVLKVCDWPQYAGCSCDSKPTEPPPVTDPCESSTEPETTPCTACTPPEPETTTCSTEEPTTTPCSTTEDPCTEATTTECPPPYPPCEPIPEPVCPEHDPEGWAVLLPDPKDCGSFYKCDWGVLYHFRCPGGLHFNNVLKVCDWPQYAGCSCDSKPTEPPPVTDPCESTEEPTTTPCSTTEDPCTEATTTECPPPYPPCEPIPEPVCPEHDPEGWAVLLPDPKDCGSFYKCDWGVLYHFRCPGGLHFNNVLKVCDWPQYAGCSCDSKPTEPPPVTDPCESTEEPTTTPCSTTEDPCTEATTTECPPPYPPCEPIPEPVCPEHDPEGWAVLLPDPKDCGSFYKCDWGVLYHFRCPGGLHFNNVLKVCDWPQYAGCSCDSKPTEPPPVTDPCESSTEPETTPCTACTPPEPETTTCSTEEPTTTPCSTTEDPCTEATTTPCHTPYPPCESIPDPVCPEHDPNGWAVLLPDPEDCGSFYKCDWGKLYHFRCPANLHFNNVLKVCDWPQYAGCSCDSKPTEAPTTTDPCTTTCEPTTEPCTSTPEPTTTCETTTCSTEAPTTPCYTPYPPCQTYPAPVCPEHDPNEWAVLLPDPEDCGSFYKCDWGKLYHFRCPANLHFNNVLKVCDWPQYAGCSCDSKPTEAPTTTDPCTTTCEPTTVPCDPIPETIIQPLPLVPM